MSPKSWIVVMGAAALLVSCSDNGAQQAEVEKLEKRVDDLEAMCLAMQSQLDEMNQPVVVTPTPAVPAPGETAVDAFIASKSPEEFAMFYFEAIQTLARIDNSLAEMAPRMTSPDLTPEERRNAKTKLTSLTEERKKALDVVYESEKAMRKADLHYSTSYAQALKNYQTEYDRRREKIRVMMLTNTSHGQLSPRDQKIHDEFREIRTADFEAAVAIGRSL